MTRRRPPAEEASELVCLTELEDVCTELLASHPDLDVTVEDARVTLDRLAAGDPSPLWLTFEPFPAMAGTLAAGDVLAASELAIATPADRTGRARRSLRDGTASWRCIGDAADDPWRRSADDVSPGAVEPSVGDAGTLGRGAGVVRRRRGRILRDSRVHQRAVVHRSGVRRPGCSRLVRAVPVDAALTGGTPAATMVTRPSAVNVAATSDAEIAVAGCHPPSELESSYPEPSMWLQAVLAAPAGADVPEGLAQDAAATLRAAGWDPPDDGHPAPSVGEHDDRPAAVVGGDPVSSPIWAGIVQPGIWAGIVPDVATDPAQIGGSSPAAAALALLAACSGGDDDGGAEPVAATSPPPTPGDCIVVDMAVSSEKIALLTELADDFNGSDEAAVGDRCVFVRPRSVASGNAANLIVDGWPNPEVNGEPPVIWSPAASGWAAIVNERAGQILAPAGTPFMLTPLVIAMPRPMAEALGWPDESIGFADLADAGREPRGLGRCGPPGVGPVPPGQDEPELLDERAQLHGRRVLRRDRQDRRPDDRGPRPAGGRGLRHPDRVGGGPLRRHHDDVPQQLVRGRRAGHGAHLRECRRRRGEERHRLQPRQPRRRALAGRGAARAPRSARRDLSRGGDALLRQPVHRARHRVGRRGREGGRGAVRGVRPAP